MNYLVFNPLASNGTGVEKKQIAVEALKDKFADLKEINVLETNNEEFVSNLQSDDVVILVGGDGTLNHLGNLVAGKNLKNDFYLFKAGTGNDFLTDIEAKEDLVLINKYLERLPKVIINGVERYFINGIGFGIDGQVCVEADKLKAKGAKKINYTGIAIKLLLTKYKCPNAIVKVDGEEFKLKKVWYASSMNGRYYGGGMMVAPSQDRLSGKLSFSSMYGSGRIKTLLVFSSIFKGEHIKHKKLVKLLEGKRIEVTFDRPTALQIDGEVVENVTTYVAEI